MFEKIRKNYLLLIINLWAFVTFVFLSLYPKWGFAKVVLTLLFCLCGSTVVILVSTIVSEKSQRIASFIGLIAYGSLCAYLFHRHFYSIIDTTLEHFGIRVSTLIVLTIYLPIMLVGTYYIQKTYDLIAAKQRHSNP